MSGAKLQLVQASRSPSVVNVALQLPPSENSLRLQDKFPSTTSLWLVLRKFEEAVAGGDAATKLNLTQRAVPSTETGQGRLNYEQPYINIMGRELGTFADLQKTLAQLGYNSGNILMRLTFKRDGAAMEEAMGLISAYFESVQPKLDTVTEEEETTKPAHGAHAAPPAEMTSVPDAGADNSAAPLEGEAARDLDEDTIMTPAPPVDDPTETPAQEEDVIASSSTTAIPSTESQFPSLQQDQPLSTAAPEPSPSSSSSQPKFSVYSAPTGNTPLAAQQPHNESDFAPSVEHAHSHQAVLNRLSQNKRLQSDKEIESAATAKKQSLADTKSAVIRVRFPDQMMVDLNMTREDTVSGLFSTIKEMLDSPDQKFELRYTSAKGRPETLDPTSQASLIKDLAIVGRVLVTMVWDPSVDAKARQQPSLKNELRGQAKKLEVQMPKEQEVETEVKTEKKELPKKKNTGSKADIEARMKKMLGFGKK